MKITAQVRSSAATHEVHMSTGDASRALPLPGKPAGGGSAVNGGELLMLALATCYCNDLHREAARLGIILDEVEVQAEARFDGIGLAARDIRYRARVRSAASEAQVERLLRETDAVAEIHNTVRAGVEVQRTPWPGTDREPALPSA